MYVTLTGARETPPARGRAFAMAMKESRRVLIFRRTNRGLGGKVAGMRFGLSL